MALHLVARGASLVCTAFRSGLSSQRTPQAPAHQPSSRRQKARNQPMPVVPLQARPFTWPPPVKQQQQLAVAAKKQQPKQRHSADSTRVSTAAKPQLHSQWAPLAADDAEAAALCELEQAIQAISSSDVPCSVVAAAGEDGSQQVVAGLEAGLQQMFLANSVPHSSAGSQQRGHVSHDDSSNWTAPAQSRQASHGVAVSSQLDLQVASARLAALADWDLLLERQGLLLDEQILLLDDIEQKTEEISLLKAQAAKDQRLIRALKLELKEAKAALAVRDEAAEHGSTEATNSAIEVEFCISCATQFGDSLLLVGDHPALGSWCLDNALQLEWSAGHIWRGSACLGLAAARAAREQVAYKAVLKRADGSLIWTAGVDWSMSLAGSTSAVHEFSFN